jgi:hypothetical protein
VIRVRISFNKTKGDAMMQSVGQRLSLFGIAVLLAASIAGCATTSSSSKAPQNWDGLQLVPSKGVDAVYLLPGVQIKTYNSVLLDPVQVAFDKNWDPNDSTRDISRRLSTDDIEKIRTEMATEFRKVFAKELTAGGYTVVEKAAPDTLRVSAGLANVYNHRTRHDVAGPVVHAHERIRAHDTRHGAARRSDPAAAGTRRRPEGR